MILNKLKIIDQTNNIDNLYLLFYVSVLCGAVNPIFLLIGTLTVSILIIVRDEILRKRQTNDNMFLDKITALESDLSAIKMKQGIKTLR